MKDGDRVRVISKFNKYKRFFDEEGTIERVYNKGCWGVRLDNHINANSSYGLYWFDPKELQIINEEEQIMFNNFNTATIRFLDGTNTDKTYNYALYDNEYYNISVGDHVVVQTGHHGLAVAVVVFISLDPVDKKKVTSGREIVCKVDLNAFHNRQANARRAKDLKKIMDDRVQQLQHDAIYILLAKEDPELASMLSEFKALTGGEQA